MNSNKEGRLSLGRQYLNDTKIDGEIQLPDQKVIYKITVNEEIYGDLYQWVSINAHYERLDTGSYLWKVLQLNDLDFKRNERTCNVLTNPGYYESHAQ